MNVSATYISNLRLALSGLIPLCFLELLAKHRAHSRPDLRPSDLLPDAGDRERLVSIIVEADLLAAGGADTKKQHERRGRQLAALAQAITILACCPGGCRFMGTRYEVVQRDGNLVMDEEDAA